MWINHSQTTLQIGDIVSQCSHYSTIVIQTYRMTLLHKMSTVIGLSSIPRYAIMVTETSTKAIYCCSIITSWDNYIVSQERIKVIPCHFNHRASISLGNSTPMHIHSWFQILCCGILDLVCVSFMVYALYLIVLPHVMVSVPVDEVGGFV